MQRFIAELGTAVGEKDFERSWRSDRFLNDKQLNVRFTLAGRRVSALVDADSSERWASPSLHRTFSTAVRRVDQSCNIRWLRGRLVRARACCLIQIFVASIRSSTSVVAPMT
jgi:hypothetical protein